MGGSSYIANRYGKANNKYMKNYNPEEKDRYIMYQDANNLYGWAMSQYLPTRGFSWITDKEIKKINLEKYTDDCKKGFIAEVDSVCFFCLTQYDLTVILVAYIIFRIW